MAYTDDELLAIIFARKRAFFACPDCGNTMALYLTLRSPRYACSRCVRARIAVLRDELEALPEWVAILDDEVRRQIAHEERKTRNAGTLDIQDYVRCFVCGRTSKVDNLRWRHVTGTDESLLNPFCTKCDEQRGAGS